MVSFVWISVFIGSFLLFHLLKFRKAGNLSVHASFVKQKLYFPNMDNIKKFTKHIQDQMGRS